MGLRSAFELLLDGERPLQNFDRLLWQSLLAGSRSSKHPWYTAALTTQADAGRFAQSFARMVVIRQVDVATRRIECHTDCRSEKVPQILENAAAGWLFWDSKSRIQLRLRAEATVLRTGPEVDAAWDATPVRSRSAYRSVKPPGQFCADNQPPSTDDREVHDAADQRGREFFCIVRTRVIEADWLYLRRGGHVRCGIDYDDDGRCARIGWKVP